MPSKIVTALVGYAEAKSASPYTTVCNVALHKLVPCRGRGLTAQQA